MSKRNINFENISNCFFKNFCILHSNIKICKNLFMLLKLDTPQWASMGKWQQWKFFKNTILNISSKFMEFYIQWSKINQFRDALTMVGALKFENFFANFSQFQEIAFYWHFRIPKDAVLVFFLILRLHISCW